MYIHVKQCWHDAFVIIYIYIIMSIRQREKKVQINFKMINPDNITILWNNTLIGYFPCKIIINSTIYLIIFEFWKKLFLASHIII